MSKSNTFENDLVGLIFNATPIANLADNNLLAPATSLYVALHTTDPGEAGNQATNEAAYTGYARVAVARDATGFTVAGNTVNLTSGINFPTGTGGSGTATHFSVGMAATGAGKMLYSGTVSPNIVLGNGITPSLTSASSITED